MSMTPPTIDSSKVMFLDALFPRGQRTLAWTWPDETLTGQELTDRQQQFQTTGSLGQRTIFISECPGQNGQQYCKRLVLHGAQGKDTGYYRCHYKDIKEVIDGTTAVRIHAFVRDPAQPFLMRGGSGSELETIYVTRSATHVIVPCLVTIPDLNVTLQSVCFHLLCHPLNLDLSRCLVPNFFCFSFSRTGSKIYEVKLFPEEPVELMVGEALTLNCTATVEFDTGVDIQWSYPGKQVPGRRCSQKLNISAGTNSWAETKPQREALSHATEAVQVLTIHYVNVTDTGPYVCTVTSMERTEILQTQVVVHGEQCRTHHYNKPVCFKGFEIPRRLVICEKIPKIKTQQTC
uniref:Platelet-derived growth factor receptor-like protein n=1 Tax=Poecilia mexicana TaxID=48701 RepID=A0A3B3WHN3_9TELE